MSDDAIIGRGGPLLLSRYAECLFWLARYMERVENLATMFYSGGKVSMELVEYSVP